MSSKRDIPVALAVAAPLIAAVMLILAIVFGMYVSEHTQTVIMHSDTDDHLSEEMADVIICLHQLKLMYGITDKAISDWVEAKTLRQAKRMEEES